MSRYTDYKDWNQEDIDFHKSIDWKARDYKDYPVPEDSFEGEVIAYTNDGVKSDRVKFIKYFRSNPIFDPYYAPEAMPFEHVVGPMYDGHRYNDYLVMDRYDSQEIYDRLSEAVEVADIVYDVNTLDYENGELKASNIEHYDTYSDYDEALETYKKLSHESFYPHVELVKVMIMEDGSYEYKVLEHTYNLEELDTSDPDYLEEDLDYSLPTSFDLKINDTIIDEIIDSSDESEYISDLITDHFGMLHNGFNYTLDFDNYLIHIDDVVWDMSEEDDDNDMLTESGIKRLIEDVLEEIQEAGGKENYLNKINDEIKAKIEEIDALDFNLKNIRTGYNFDNRHLDEPELKYDLEQAESDLQLLFMKKDIAEQQGE